jgi:hypothetical protein
MKSQNIGHQLHCHLFIVPSNSTRLISCTKQYFNKTGQCTCNVTLRRVHVTVVATEEHQCVLCALLKYSHCQICKKKYCVLHNNALAATDVRRQQRKPTEFSMQNARYFCRILNKIFSFLTDLHNNTKDQTSRKSAKW